MDAHALNRAPAVLFKVISKRSHKLTVEARARAQGPRLLAVVIRQKRWRNNPTGVTREFHLLGLFRGLVGFAAGDLLVNSRCRNCHIRSRKRLAHSLKYGRYRQ